MKIKPAQAAFTLIELLIVVAVLGVLATMVILRFTGAQASALDTKRKSELRQYQNALEIFATRGAGLYYNSTATIAANSMCAAIGATSCAQDPKVSSGWQNYRYQSSNGGADYVLWATLEKNADAVAATPDFFVVCSDGQAGIVAAGWSGPTNGVCPI